MNTTSALNTAGARPLQFPIPANVYAETVVSVKHYTDRLFSFRITRPQSLRFRSGEILESDTRPVPSGGHADEVAGLRPGDGSAERLVVRDLDDSAGACECRRDDK